MSVKSFNGNKGVDIRQYDRFGDKIYPTKSGIFMGADQFDNLVSFIADIDTEVEDFKDKKVESFEYIIGGGIHVNASSGYPVVHIRWYYQNETMPFALPTKKGMALRFDEWTAFVKLIDNIQKRLEINK